MCCLASTGTVRLCCSFISCGCLRLRVVDSIDWLAKGKKKACLSTTSCKAQLLPRSSLPTLLACLSGCGDSVCHFSKKHFLTLFCYPLPPWTTSNKSFKHSSKNEAASIRQLQLWTAVALAVVGDLPGIDVGGRDICRQKHELEYRLLRKNGGHCEEQKRNDSSGTYRTGENRASFGTDLDRMDGRLEPPT